MKLNLPLVSFSALTLLSLPSGAALVNLYTFNDGTANDSVGGQNGNIVGPNGVFAGGKFDISANNGENNVNASLTYVNLPNNLITTAVNSGTAGQFSFSLWFTVATNRDWASALSFGTTDGGENGNSGAGSSPYIQLIPDTGDGANTLRLTTHSPGNELGISRANGATAALATNINVIGTFVNASNFNFYVDGVLVGTNPVVTGLDLTTFANNNNWLGRGQWNGDAGFDGAFDELAIYNTALTPSEVSSVFAAGPVPEPTSALLGVFGAAALASRRRRN
ncbi:MAG: putative secreted glycosylase [Verrucomicrobiales bacterium]|nr:putative secreted glycosylase [Verrucomicrobiales bacterium]